ncbi:lipase family protein [Marinimicrobium locisalis]|uniref:lipase family protein n=1 Tax=Marinimicrobium locisalis TaxID=546022 RepID=UPI0032221FDE
MFSSGLARWVYFIKDSAGMQLIRAKFGKSLVLDAKNVVSGTTGGLFIVKKSKAMAMLTLGQGEYKGQAFILYTGTTDLYDTVTDLNTGIKTSHTGSPIHQGFYYAFDSTLMELRQFVSRLQAVHTVHCVGHSLGGALAALAADWVRKNNASLRVKLYTFGSPRVGLEMFAKTSTTRLLAQNIYRVYHKTDPVPMVPTWPFFHAPTGGTDYLIHSPMGAIPWEYHRMRHYAESAKKAGSWSTIQNNRPKTYLDSTVEQWLESEGVVAFTANSLELVNAALLYVIKKVLHATGVVLVGAAATTLTLLDRLAIFLAKAVEVSAELSRWVYYLVRKMASMVGIVVKEGTSLTVAFIRLVFTRLYERVANMVRQAGRDPQ